MRKNKTILRLIAVIIMVVMTSVVASAQIVGLKTNLINDVALSPNIGAEFGVAPKWTVQLTGQVNFWKISDRSWKHAMISPEARYWFCQCFAGHFLGIHALGGFYNFGNLNIPINFLGSDFRNLKTNRYQGWGAGAGINYGYAWPVHKHWNIEAEIGIGWIYTRFDSYPCQVCGTKKDSDKAHNYFGLTKFGVNLEYLF